jgi:hypothetical protein
MRAPGISPPDKDSTVSLAEDGKAVSLVRKNNCQAQSCRSDCPSEQFASDQGRPADIRNLNLFSFPHSPYSTYRELN